MIDLIDFLQVREPPPPVSEELMGQARGVFVKARRDGLSPHTSSPTHAPTYVSTTLI